MRTLVDIGDNELRALDDLARRESKSRAALIRAAVADYLAKHRRTPTVDAFGLWGNRKTDGLAYQEELRREW
jgi:metal-responsive CopG/Arc/MetJ family transcriptional regulator